jgi:hypothetical protein
MKMPLYFPSPLAGEGGSHSETDEGFAKFKHLTYTPHPAFGHLLPQGEKDVIGN